MRGYLNLLSTTFPLFIRILLLKSVSKHGLKNTRFVENYVWVTRKPCNSQPMKEISHSHAMTFKPVDIRTSSYWIRSLRTRSFRIHSIRTWSYRTWYLRTRSLRTRSFSIHSNRTWYFRTWYFRTWSFRTWFFRTWSFGTRSFRTRSFIGHDLLVLVLMHLFEVDQKNYSWAGGIVSLRPTRKARLVFKQQLILSS